MSSLFGFVISSAIFKDSLAGARTAYAKLCLKTVVPTRLYLCLDAVSFTYYSAFRPIFRRKKEIFVDPSTLIGCHTVRPSAQICESCSSSLSGPSRMQKLRFASAPLHKALHDLSSLRSCLSHIKSTKGVQQSDDLHSFNTAATGSRRLCPVAAIYYSQPTTALQMPMQAYRRGGLRSQCSTGIQADREPMAIRYLHRYKAIHMTRE